MALQGDLGAYLSGGPVYVQDCNIAVTPPSVKSIMIFGEEKFLMATQLFTKTDMFLRDVRQGNSELAKFNDFQLLLVILNEEAKSKRLVKDYFELVFPDYHIELTESSINYTIEGRVVGRITPFNFEELQVITSELFEPYKDKKEEYNPVNDKAAEIAAKLKKGKQKIAELKGKGKQEDTSLFATYLSVLGVGLSIDMNILLSYTPFQLYDTFTRYFAKVQSDIYQQISMQPFADTSKIEAPEEWYRNLYG
jgi:hypothetical protein